MSRIRGPSLYDLGGCFRIAALQHATAIGFVLAGVVAGVGTAEEAGSGALSDMALREPRRARLVLVKAVAISLTLVASMLLTHRLALGHQLSHAASRNAHLPERQLTGRRHAD